MKDVTFIYYTNNLTPRKLLLNSLLLTIGYAEEFAKSLVITSQSKISKSPKIVPLFSGVENVHVDKAIVTGEFFDESENPSIESFVVGRSEPTLVSLAKQLVFTLKQVKTEFVVFTEDDVFYPNGYFQKVTDALTPKFNIVYYSDSVMFSKDGFFTLKGHLYLSRYSGRTEYFLKHFSEMTDQIDEFEPNSKGFGRSKGVEPFVLVSGPPVLDIKHGLNVSGTHLVQSYEEINDFWGRKETYLDLIKSDAIDEIEKDNPMLFVGLDMMTRRGWKPSKGDGLFRMFPDRRLFEEIRELTQKKSNNVKSS